jgi:hypothetical protein
MDRGVLIWPLLCGTRAWPQTGLSKSLKLAVRSKPGRLAYPQVDGGLGAGWALLSGAAHFSADSIDHAWRMIGNNPLRLVVFLNDLPLTTVRVRSELNPRVRSVLHEAGLSHSDIQIVPVGFGHSFISAIMATTNRFIHFHSAAEIASRLPARSVGDRYVFVIVTARSCSSLYNPQLCVGR